MLTKKKVGMALNCYNVSLAVLHKGNNDFISVALNTFKVSLACSNKR